MSIVWQSTGAPQPLRSGSDRSRGRLSQPLSRIAWLLADIEMAYLIAVVEPVNGNHVLANEFIAAVVPLLVFLEYRIAYFGDMKHRHLEPRAAAHPARQELPIVGPVQLLQIGANAFEL